MKVMKTLLASAALSLLATGAMADGHVDPLDGMNEFERVRALGHDTDKSFAIYWRSINRPFYGPSFTNDGRHYPADRTGEFWRSQGIGFPHTPTIRD